MVEATQPEFHSNQHNSIQLTISSCLHCAQCAIEYTMTMVFDSNKITLTTTTQRQLFQESWLLQTAESVILSRLMHNLIRYADCFILGLVIISVPVKDMKWRYGRNRDERAVLAKKSHKKNQDCVIGIFAYINILFFKMCVRSDFF